MPIATARPHTDLLFTPAAPQAAATASRFGLLARLRVLFTFARDPLAGFTAAQFDKPYDQFEFFGRPSTVLNDASLIKHFFVENAANYRYGDLRQSLLKPALREGLLTSEGETWRRARRTMAPIFTPRNVQAFAGPMREATLQYCATIRPGEARISPKMCELAFHALSEALFSGEITADAKAMLADTELFLRTLGHVDPTDILGFPEWVPRPTKLRGGASVKRLRALVRERIDARAARITEGADMPRDLLTLLLEARGEDGAGFGHDEIEDHLLTFIGAGHETVARTLAWTLYLLAGDASARARVEAEVDSLDVDGIAPQDWSSHLPFLRACVEESMRLFPPICHIVRIAKVDDTHDGVFVAAGSTIIVNIWMLHRHRLHWQQPDAFDPDRFMAPRRAAFDRFHYLPFGAGLHVCIGASFAMQELAIVLAILLRRFRFEYAGAEPPRALTRVTTQPHNEMPMVIYPR